MAALSMLVLSAAAHAQAPETKPRVATGQETKAQALSERDRNTDPIRMYHLKGVTDYNSENEKVQLLRSLLDPTCRVIQTPSENKIFVRCAAEFLETADLLMRQADTAKPNYRLTYTIVESDGSKRVGVQHFTMDVVPGARATLKNGSRVPVATGSYNSANSQSQTQFTYLDVGLNFDVTLEEGPDGVRLKNKIEQSATAEEKTISGVTEPIVRQVVLEGSALLTEGKPLSLGSLDVAGSARHLDVEVLLERVK